MTNKEIFEAMDDLKETMDQAKEDSKELVKQLGDDLDKMAHEGDCQAQLKAYHEELNVFMEMLLEVEKNLLVAHKTEAKRRLQRKKMLIQQEILYYQQKQDEVLKQDPCL